ncbi:MAG: RNA-binding protein [Thiobacillus sp. 65-29]|nr:MAG: RNA-binding protein [Thiobacillus sp. 65-29]
MSADRPPLERMRLDKWLWAARFYKTRQLANEAIENGRVKVDGARVKPAREVKPGDRLELRLGESDWTLTVRALSMQRGPAPQARTLYEEDADSRMRREREQAERRLVANPAAALKGRPTKRDRRQIHRFTGE